MEAVVFLEPSGNAFYIAEEARRRGYATYAYTTDPESLTKQIDNFCSNKLFDSTFTIDSWFSENICDRILVSLSSSNCKIVAAYSGYDLCAYQISKIRSLNGLPTSDPEMLKNILDKHWLRCRLKDLGLSNIRSFTAAEISKWHSWNIPGAGYFKPRNGFGSAYVKRCESMESLRDAIDSWRRNIDKFPVHFFDYISANGFCLEQEISGELLSVEAVMDRGEFHLLGLLSRILFSENRLIEMGSCFPYQHQFESQIIAKVKAAHVGLGLFHGPTHTEVIVTDTGDVEIIDLNPRLVGADVIQSINFAFDTKLQEYLLDNCLGLPFKLQPIVRSYSCLQYFMMPATVPLQSVEFPGHQSLTFSRVFLEKGYVATGTKRYLDYLGCYLVNEKTTDKALEVSKALRSQIKINDELQGIY